MTRARDASRSSRALNNGWPRWRRSRSLPGRAPAGRAGRRRTPGGRCRGHPTGRSGRGRRPTDRCEITGAAAPGRPGRAVPPPPPPARTSSAPPAAGQRLRLRGRQCSARVESDLGQRGPGVLEGAQGLGRGVRPARAPAPATPRPARPAARPPWGPAARPGIAGGCDPSTNGGQVVLGERPVLLRPALGHGLPAATGWAAAPRRPATAPGPSASRGGGLVGPAGVGGGGGPRAAAGRVTPSTSCRPRRAPRQGVGGAKTSDPR